MGKKTIFILLNYISAVKDLHTGMLEGFAVKDYQTRELIRESFKYILNKSLPEGTIIHSDQGTLYNYVMFENELKDKNFIQSMSRKGTPIDNSPMESFFGCPVSLDMSLLMTKH